MMVFFWVLLILPLCSGMPIPAQRAQRYLPSTPSRDMQYGRTQQAVLRVDHDRHDIETTISPPTAEKGHPLTPRPVLLATLSSANLRETSTPREGDVKTIQSSASPYLHTLKEEQFYINQIVRHFPEIVAIWVFLLIPVAVGLVKVAERIGRPRGERKDMKRLCESGDRGSKVTEH